MEEPQMTRVTQIRQMSTSQTRGREARATCTHARSRCRHEQTWQSAIARYGEKTVLVVW
ncbi:MAG: hypothetical protein LBT53_03050 [Puniceicoccales bacterium]|nr:hypothetical protein [Puniceicoccales bacterium]